MNICKKIHDYLNNLPDLCYIIIMIIFSYLIDNLMVLFANISNIDFSGPEFNMSPILMFILVGIIGPLVETYL